MRILKPTPPGVHIGKTANQFVFEWASLYTLRRLIVNAYMQRLAAGLALVLCSFLATSLPVKAATGPGLDRWAFGGSAYLWAAGVEGTSAEGDDIDISFTDVLDDLEGGIMGILAARKGKWTVIADLLYLSIHQEDETTANLVGLPVELEVDVKLRGFVSTFGVAYRVIEVDRTSLDLLAGARYFDLDVDFEAGLAARKIEYSDSGHALDGIIGGQLLTSLTDRWYLSFYGDIGAGDNKLTWQAWPIVGYRLENLDVVAGYRHLEWETDDGDTFDDLNFSGPLLGVKFRF